MKLAGGAPIGRPEESFDKQAALFMGRARVGKSIAIQLADARQLCSLAAPAELETISSPRGEEKRRVSVRICRPESALLYPSCAVLP